MGFAPNPIGLVSLLAALFALGMGALVYFTRPSQAGNRRLALVLFFEACWVLGGSGLIYLTDDVATAYGSQAVDETALLLLPVLYLFFLATLDTPLVAPLRRRGVQAALVVAVLAAEAWWFTHPERFIAGMRRPSYAPWEAVSGPDHLAAIAVLGFVSLFALAAAVDAYVRTLPGTPARRRMFAFVLAFGVRDVGFALFTLVVRPLTPLGGGDALPEEYYLAGTALTLLAHVPLLGYGILRTQLFEIDRQLHRLFRWTAVPGAVAFAVAAAGLAAHGFFDASPGTAALVGLAAGAPVALAAVPLGRAARFVSALALPNVDESPDYQSARRLEMYRSALEETYARGRPGDRDVEFLEDMRRRLGVSKEEHRVLHLVARSTPPRAGAAARGLDRERFRVVRELGQGGSGRALLAEDGLLGRSVVLKQPLAPWLLDEGGREEFMREARLLAKVQHPNVVALHEVLADAELPVLVLEYVEGGSLEERLRRRGPLAPEEAVRLGLGLLAGLDRIHRDGIVHRDVKPGNVLLGRDGEAKLTDFGIAQPRRAAGAKRTRRGTVRLVGSLGYMSPEQARGEDPDERTDLYSVAVTLFESVTGRHYLDLAGRTEEEVRRAIQEAPPRLPDPRVPAAVERVLERALAKKAGERFRDAAQMAAALRAALPAPPPRRARAALPRRTR